MMFLVLVLGSTLTGRAQTGEEWFRQKETAKKYLLEQIAALKVYGDYARKSYQIADKGWGILQGIKEGDVKLHSDFMASLSMVNPRIQASPLVGGIIHLQARTVRKIKAIRHCLNTSQRLTDPESKFCNQVLDGLLQEGAVVLEELLLLTASGGLELSDDQRLQRLHRLYAAVQQTYSVASSLETDVGLRSFQILRQGVEIDRSRSLHGLR